MNEYSDRFVSRSVVVLLPAKGCFGNLWGSLLVIVMIGQNHWHFLDMNQLY